MSLPNPINVTYVSPQSGDTFPFIYIVKDIDNIINIDTTHGAVHVILRNIRNSGMLQYQPLLSINDGGNNAFFNNITIYPSEGDTINDATSYVLNINGSNSIIQLSNINQWVVSSSQNPIPFEGSNYVYVYGNGTPLENGQELLNAYARAKEMVGQTPKAVIEIGTINVIEDNWDVEAQNGYWLTDSMPISDELSVYFGTNEIQNESTYSSFEMNPPLINKEIEFIVDYENNTYQIGKSYSVEEDGRLGEYTDTTFVYEIKYNTFSIGTLEIVESEYIQWYSGESFNYSIFDPIKQNLTGSESIYLKIDGVYYPTFLVNGYYPNTFRFSSYGYPRPENGTYDNVECYVFNNVSNIPINNISLIIGSGNYEITEGWIIDTPMNVVSLTGDADVFVSLIDDIGQYNYTIEVKYDSNLSTIINQNENFDWRIKGLNTINTESGYFEINTDANFTIENCIAGDYSFKNDLDNNLSILNATFMNCRGGVGCFYAYVMQGKFIDCYGSDESFGHYAFEDSSEYINCEGADLCFGRGVEFLTASYENCKGSQRCFGYDVRTETIAIFKNCEVNSNEGFCYNNSQGSVIIESTFINCVGEDFAFCYDDDGSGIDLYNCLFLNCRARNDSFGIDIGDSSDNEITNCIAINDSFKMNGIYTNCKANNGSFQNMDNDENMLINCIGGQSFENIYNAKFFNCFAESFSFLGGGGNTYYNCKSGENSFQNYNGTSNEYNNCVGGLNSFVENDDNLAPTENKLYFCRLTEGTFPSSTGAGLIRQSIDGGNVLINQG
jgi:hypothetical protein